MDSTQSQGGVDLFPEKQIYREILLFGGRLQPMETKLGTVTLTPIKHVFLDSIPTRGTE
jgi:hypothetical protein